MKPDLYSQRTKLPNGKTHVTVSTKPLRFVDAGGVVRDYDTTVVASGGVYTATATPFTFRTLPSGVGFVYGDERGETTYRLRGAVQRGVPDVAGNEVWFRNALAHVDVGFVVSRTGVRSLKRLKNVTAAKSFIWDVETTGTPIRTRPPLGRDNANDLPVSHLPQRRDLEITTAESAITVVGGVSQWTLTETWTGRVKTFTKPNRIPAWTTDPVYPVVMDPTVGPITADAEDGDELGGTWYNRYYQWTAGRVTGVNEHGTVRFANVTVPQGATITSASLDFDVNGVYNTPGSLLIQGDDVDDAPQWSDTSKPSSGFTGTTATTAWTTDATTGSVVKTVTSIVQEIVNRAGWVSGNAMRFAVLNQDGSGTHALYVDASDTAGNETRLTVEYAVGGSALLLLSPGDLGALGGL